MYYYYILETQGGDVVYAKNCICEKNRNLFKVINDDYT